MRLHNHPLFRRKPAFLAQKHREVIVDLADVMQKCCRRNVVDLLRRKSQLAGERTCITGYPNRVARCVRVSRLDGFDHELQQFSVRLLHLKIHLVHVANEKEANRQNPETEKLQTDVQKVQENGQRRRNQIVQQRSTQDPCEGLPYRHTGRYRNGKRHTELVDHEERHDQANERRQAERKCIQSSLAAQSPIDDAAKSYSQHVLSYVEPDTKEAPANKEDLR